MYLREQHRRLLDVVVQGGRREVLVVVRVHHRELRVAASEFLGQSLPIGVIEGAAIAREMARLQRSYQRMCHLLITAAEEMSRTS